MTRLVKLLALCCALAACSDGESMQVITGRIDASKGALAIRAIADGDVVTATPVRTDGSFTLTLPAGTTYRLEVLTTTGVKNIVQRSGNILRDLSFTVCQPTDPFDVGGVGDPNTDGLCMPGDVNCTPCDPMAGTSCEQPPLPPTCDPMLDPACRCDIVLPDGTCCTAGDPSCGPLPCMDGSDPNCCDANGFCPPPPCDANDPMCQPPPPCDPATDPTCCYADGSCPPTPGCQPGEPNCAPPCDPNNVVLSAGQTWRASVITADLSQTRTQTESTQPPSQAEPPLARIDPPAVAPTATEVSKLAVTDGPASTTAARKFVVTHGVAPTAAPKLAVTDGPTSTTVAPKPAVTDGPTSTTAAPKPGVTAAPKPGVSAAPKPGVTAAPKSAVTAAPKFGVTAAPTPTTPAPKSAVAEPPTPTTQAPKPAVTEAPTKPAAEAPKPAVTETPRPAVTETPRPASIEQRFKRGWELLRAGKAQQAADELAAAADASPDAPLAADARYFQAVALVRANDPRAAERVLVQFLDSAPKSLRRGRAAVLLGRLLAERGDTRSARAWLESAANDPDPAIAAAAKAGLQALK